MSSEVSLLLPLSDAQKRRLTSYKVTQINRSRLLSDVKIESNVDSLFDPYASPPSGSSEAQECQLSVSIDTKPCFHPFRNLRRY